MTIWDVDGPLAERTAAELGDGARSFAVDVLDFTAVQAAARGTLGAFGRIDALVTSARLAGMNATVIDDPVEEWRWVLDVNLNRTFHCCKRIKRILPALAKQTYGRVVLIAPIAAKDGNPNAAAHSASKAGVIALAVSLGKEHAARDIAIDCITPAAARTRIFDQMTKQHIASMLSNIPRGRSLELDEAASLIARLCTRENGFCTGAVFDLSGGRMTYSGGNGLRAALGQAQPQRAVGALSRFRHLHRPACRQRSAGDGARRVSEHASPPRAHRSARQRSSPRALSIRANGLTTHPPRPAEVWEVLTLAPCLPEHSHRPHRSACEARDDESRSCRLGTNTPLVRRKRNWNEDLHLQRTLPRPQPPRIRWLRKRALTKSIT